MRTFTTMLILAFAPISSSSAARVAALLALTALGAGVASGAHAQAFDAVRLYDAAADRDGGTVGLAVVAGHAYMGSDERRTRAYPAAYRRGGLRGGDAASVHSKFPGPPPFPPV